NPSQAAVTRITDRFGNRLTFTRATNGTLTRIQSVTAGIDFIYDASRRITQATDNIGRRVSYQYDATGRLWKVTDVAGGVTEYGYDGLGRMRTIKDPRSITYLTNIYDANSRVAQQTMANGATYQFVYTLNGNGKVAQTTVTDPRGIGRRTSFNAVGYWTSDARAVGRAEQQTVSVQRDAVSNFILSQTDTLLRATAFGYDTLGNLTSATRLSATPNAVTTMFSYEPTYSQLASVTNPLNKSTTFGYGYRDALATVTDPLGHQVFIVSNTRGQPVAIADGAGTTNIEYSG